MYFFLFGIWYITLRSNKIRQTKGQVLDGGGEKVSIWVNKQRRPSTHSRSEILETLPFVTFFFVCEGSCVAESVSFGEVANVGGSLHQVFERV